MRARNSGLFYWLAKWSTELRDMTVFYELLNKKGNHFDFTIGQMIQPEDLEGDVGEVTKALEHHAVFELANDGNARFEAAKRTPAASAA
jgi:putative hemolysin